MQKTWWFDAPEQSRQVLLPGGGTEQIFAANYQVNFLIEIVHRYGELIRPLTKPVAYEEVAALERRCRDLRAKQQIVERFNSVVYTNASRQRRCLVEISAPAAPIVAEFLVGHFRRVTGDRPARTIARIHQTVFVKRGQRLFVSSAAVTLRRRNRVGLEAEPCKVAEQGRFVFRATTRPIVIFNAEHHVPAVGLGNSPYIDRIEHVAQMQTTGGGGSEPCGPMRRERRGQRAPGHVGRYFVKIDFGIITCTPSVPSTSSVTSTSQATLVSM